MATVGQIVYNLQDFHTSGGLISTSSSGGIISSGDTTNYDTYKSGRIDIFDSTNNLVSKYSSTGFTKVGIQAPPGTKVMLNNNKEILIGRTGVYEVDDDITITSMYFIRPKKYEKDADATEQALQDGITAFAAAESARESSLATLDEQYVGKDKDADYWDKYTIIQDTYDEAYQIALAKYTQGVNGIYKLPNETDVDADENYEDLYNIIVDFIY